MAAKQSKSTRTVKKALRAPEEYDLSFGSDFEAGGDDVERAEAYGLNEPGDGVMGRYLGYRVITGKKRKHQIHLFAEATIRTTDDGETQTFEPEEPIEVWGKALLNGQLELIDLGSRVRIIRLPEERKIGEGVAGTYRVTPGAARIDEEGVIGRGIKRGDE